MPVVLGLSWRVGRVVLRALASGIAAAGHGAAAALRAIRNRQASARLAQLDERMLADIGLTRSDLRDAFAEPLWHDPTDVLARRARERRQSRPGAGGSLVAAPPLAPWEPLGPSVPARRSR